MKITYSNLEKEINYQIKKISKENPYKRYLRQVIDLTNEPYLGKKKDTKHYSGSEMPTDIEVVGPDAAKARSPEQSAGYSASALDRPYVQIRDLQEGEQGARADQISSDVGHGDPDNFFNKLQELLSPKLKQILQDIISIGEDAPEYLVFLPDVGPISAGVSTGSSIALAIKHLMMGDKKSAGIDILFSIPGFTLLSGICKSLKMEGNLFKHFKIKWVNENFTNEFGHKIANYAAHRRDILDLISRLRSGKQAATTALGMTIGSIKTSVRQNPKILIDPAFRAGGAYSHYGYKQDLQQDLEIRQNLLARRKEEEAAKKQEMEDMILAFETAIDVVNANAQDVLGKELGDAIEILSKIYIDNEALYNKLRSERMSSSPRDFVPQFQHVQPQEDAKSTPKK